MHFIDQTRLCVWVRLNAKNYKKSKEPLDQSYEIKRKSIKEDQEKVNEIAAIEWEDTEILRKMQIVENTPNEKIEDEEENNFVRENRYADTHTYVMNNEMSVLIKILAEKYDNNQNKSFITIESFAKVVPDFDGYSIPVQQWIHNINENAEVRNKIHKMLQNRKKRGSENVHEYIIQMRKIAALGQIEDKSIIS